MGDALRLTIEGWFRQPFRFVVTVLWFPLLLAVATRGQQAPEPVTFFHLWFVWLVGLTWGSELGENALRTGTRLVPGLTGHVLRSTGALVAVMILVPIGLMQIVGGDVLLMAGATGLPLFLALCLGLTRQAGSKIQIFSFAVIPMVFLVVFDETKSSIDTWRVPVSTASMLLGSSLIAFVLWRIARGTMDRWPYSGRSSNTSPSNGDGVACDEAGSMRMARFAPSFMRHEIRYRRAPGSLDVRALRRQWLQSGSPTNLLGTAVFLAPLVFLMSYFQSESSTLGVGMFPLLFATNGLGSFGMLYSRSRMRREWLRPAPREVLLRSFGVAFARDVLGLASVAITASAAGVLAKRPEVASDIGFWGIHLFAFAVALFGIPVAYLLIRRGRFGGMVAFFLTFVSSSIYAGWIHDSEPANELVWWGTGIALCLGLGTTLLPFARRVWQNVEVG